MSTGEGGLARWILRPVAAVTRRWQEWRDARQEFSDSMDEMQFHIEEETARNIRHGMAPEQARRAAKLAFGGVDRFTEQAHADRPRTRWSEFRMSYLDWKLGGRMLLKYPGMSLVSVITLMAAIGLGSAWFELSMMIFRPTLPLDEGHRIVRVEYWDREAMKPELRTLHEFPQWRDQLTTIEQLGAHRTVERNLLVAGAAPQVVKVAEISASAFSVARVAPVLGRPLQPADEEQGGDDVVVISHEAWQRYFAGDAGIVGREVQVGLARATVVGVMPEGFRFPRSHHFWMPLRAAAVEPLEGAPVQVFGRLRDGRSMEAAATELATWSARMAQASPETHQQLKLDVLPFAAPREAGLSFEILMVNIAAWLILALACMNVAALMFARTALREGEIVVRNALGASRARVMGQLFTEALVLTSVAAVLGLIALSVFLPFVQMDNNAPFWWDASLEPFTILYAMALAVVGAGMVGLLPALRATGAQVRSGLAHLGSSGTSMRFGGAWSVIIVLQVAFSVLCLPFGIAAASDAMRKTQVGEAFPADGYLTFRPVLDTDDGTPGDQGVAGEQARLVLAELGDVLAAQPEVAGVAMTEALPGMYHPLFQVEALRDGDAPFLVDAYTEGDRVRVGSAGPGYFSMLDRTIVAGREFAPGDVGAADPVVVINESLARNIGGNPVGTRLRVAETPYADAGPWLRVVGVVGNFGLTPTGDGEADFMYTAALPEETRYMVARVNGDMAAFTQRLRALAMDVDPTLRLHDVQTLREVIRADGRDMLLATLIGTAVVLLAIILSAASLYALMSVGVALRTREIGIRIAIGASPRGVLVALFRRAAKQVGIGVVIGNVLMLIALSTMVQEMQLRYVLGPMVAASLVMLLVGVGACFVPARRALRVQPVTALKEG